MILIFQSLLINKFQTKHKLQTQQQYKLNYKQKMTHNITALPRNIRFNEQNIRNFVQGSSFLNATSIAKQNYNTNNQTVLANTYNHFANTKIMGFDSYNKNNLLLRTCNAEDIQYVTKNPVVYQQDVIVFAEQSKYPKSSKNIPKQKQQNILKQQQQYKAKTTKDFYRSQHNKEESNTEKLSKQAELNEFLFNHRKQQQEKKNKKIKFLQQIEKRINSIEQQTYSLAQEKQKQYQQLNGILKIQQSATKLANKADLVGKINNAIHETEYYDKSKIYSPKKITITEDMAMLEINAAIAEQHQCNDALLDEIERVSRSKSKSRNKVNVNVNVSEAESKKVSPKKTGIKKIDDDFHPQPTSLSKTIRRPMQVPPRPSSSKKMTATWKGK